MAEEETLVSKLEKLLGEMKPWEKKPVLKAGRIVIEIVKLPERQTKSRMEPERLVLHIRREDAFRGLFIKELEELEDLHTAINTEKVKKIVEAIEEISRKKKIQEYEL